MGAATHASRPVPAGPLSPCPFQLWAHPSGWCLPYLILPLHLPKPLFLASLSGHKVTPSFGIWEGLPSVWSVPWSKGLDFYQVSREMMRPEAHNHLKLQSGLPAGLPHPQCSWCSQAQPGEEPMGVAPGREQRVGEEMGKQGTLHPRKHPCSSAGVVPEHTQTDRFRQTHTETHTPNGCFPSLKAPTSCPSTPLPL